MTDDLARGFQRTTSGARLPPTRVGKPGSISAGSSYAAFARGGTRVQGAQQSRMRGAERLTSEGRTRPPRAPHPSLACLARLLGENTLIMPGLDPGIHSVSAQ